MGLVSCPRVIKYVLNLDLLEVGEEIPASKVGNLSGYTVCMCVCVRVRGMEWEVFKIVYSQITFVSTD